MEIAKEWVNPNNFFFAYIMALLNLLAT